jgi:fluoroquinolone resistance protein
LFAVRFERCVLNFSSFYGMKMKKTRFMHSVLQETDFTETDLTGAVFDHCDLLNAHFEQTNLEQADFTTAFNYAINPAVNKLKKARFSSSGLPGLLYSYDIIIVE